MIINYFKTALRNLFNHKLYSIINIAGLSIGVACFILILFYVYNETSFDKHHDNSKQIYRMALKANMGGKDIEATVSGGPLGMIAKNEIPEIINYTRLRELNTTILFTCGDKQFYQDRMMYADSTFFDVFKYQALYGNLKTALDHPYSLVMSESTARKYLGDKNPIGESIKWNNARNYTVTAVFKDPEKNSHIDFDVFISYVSLFETERGRQLSSSFFAFTTINYIVANPQAKQHEIERKIAEIVEKYMGDAMREHGSTLGIFLQPVRSIHLHSHLLHEFGQSGDINKVYIFSAVAILILFIACINFINLATARSNKRALEVGVRKVFGANKSMLFRQFITESFITAIISIGIAVLLINILLPVYNNLTGNTLDLSALSPLVIGLLFFVLAIGIGLISGSYPALFISSFQPIKVLKGSFFSSKKKSVFLNAMVVLQFVISVFLIISTIVVYRQITFLGNKDLGINPKSILVIPLREAKIRNDYQSIKAEFQNISGVKAVTSSSRALGNFNQRRSFLPEGCLASESRMFMLLNIDPNYLDVMETEIVMGRGFYNNSKADSAKIIINQTLQKELEWDQPIGKYISSFDPADNKETKFKIIGVIKDFNHASLHTKVEPMMLFPSQDNYYLNVKFDQNNQAQVIKNLESKWNEMYPSNPFNYFIQEEKLKELYRTEETMGDLFIYFTGLAIFIALLGLFGLTTFKAEQRTKEVGIRKVMGGSIGKIVNLLTFEFAKLVIIANLIAWPLAFYFAKDWLQNFSYSTSIKWWIFPVAGILSLLLSIIIVGTKAYQSAVKNPVDALKYE